jgi:uncharacterized protein (TIGR02611 family)
VSHTTLSPRAQALVTHVETWSDGGPVRAVAVKALVTVGGPLVVVAGVAMLVLPGPGLVVIALGFALLAVEYEWARGLLALLGHGLSRVKRAALPRDASTLRRLVALACTAGFVVGTTVLTGAITTYLGSKTFL